MTDNPTAFDTKAQVVIGVCSNRPRPSVQNSRSYMLKTGESAWGRDVWHVKGEGQRTLCGRDASEFLTIGELAIDWHCCTRCSGLADRLAKLVGE